MFIYLSHISNGNNIKTNKLDIHDEVPEEVPEIIFGEGFLVLYFGVDITVVQEMDICLLHLNVTMVTHMCLMTSAVSV